MSGHKKKIAIIGGSGVVGRAMLQHLVTVEDVDLEVVGLSRRPADIAGTHHITLDLLDADRCRELSETDLADVTHIIYTALYEKPGLITGWQDKEQMQTNLNMLRNLMDPLLASSTSLRHVTLLQGTKAYGAHIKPMNIPGKEREPRVVHENFYWLQEDYLRERQAGQSWYFTIWRPQIIFGHALGAPMNMIAALGVYGAIQKAKGGPLNYPGGPSGIMEAIDADLLASAIAFSLDNPDFENETFNITNGDVFTWENLWQGIANCLKMEAGEPSAQFLSRTLYEEEDLWGAIVDEFGLQKHSIRELVGDSFFYADALFNTAGETPSPPALVSTIKLRQAGFHECMDTEEMMLKWFNKLRGLNILPDAGVDLT
jgi:nucleoside-diphosphate-sugar epimerase